MGIAFGVLFTAAGPVGTWLTLRAGREEPRTAREGQVTECFPPLTRMRSGFLAPESRRHR
ncbi:hypothetical protein [Actinomadura kijaniata]|uniref:hypothetical protein n=1 Tax=Actinomadura kijaniata TaxID=46161 RepID=UPI000833326E|nr:hypothetical protein [Actinomadura kijaniata]